MIWGVCKPLLALLPEPPDLALLREARESRRCESGDEVRELMDELASLRSRMGLAGLIWRPGDCYKR